jgi:hypothetical protein
LHDIRHALPWNINGGNFQSCFLIFKNPDPEFGFFISNTLCDVIGREELERIKEIHVHRVMSYSDISRESDSSSMQRTDEYWEDRDVIAINEGDACLTEECKQIHQSQIKEDQLILKTHHGQLYLRFHGDFGHFEMNRDSIMKESKEGETIFMNNALQWCQTIGHLVGAGRLNQDLPHFGDNTSDEIRDYLTVVTRRNMLEGQWHRLKDQVKSYLHLNFDTDSPDVRENNHGVVT